MTDVADRLAAALADRYRLERELGRGGMAAVWLAHDTRLERRVALKVLREDVAALLGADRFLREIRLTAGLDHPHILALLDSGSADGALFYVMPYVADGSLRDRLDRDGTLSVAEALRVAREVADALAYAHARGIVHRDIKPENVLLAAGHARVADFGIARAVSRADETRLTQVGVVVGTPAYMSPEQAVGESVDGRSDLYALGCVLWEMLTGSVPHAAGTGGAHGLLTRRFREPVPRLRERLPHASVELERLIGQLLSPDPSQRPADAGEAMRALESAALAQPAEGPGRRATTPAPRTRSVAVLPFVNLSADPENEYFSDGMTEELMAVLTGTPGLRVAARSSAFAYKGRSADARVVGRELNVDTVLSGSIRKSGARIRLSAQLTTVEDGYQVWAHTYDRELSDVFAVQDEISQAIAQALQIRLTSTGSPAGGRQGTDDVEAYTDYLRGRFHWSRRIESEVRKGLANFEAALARDPDYALAHIGVADSYNILGFYCWMPPKEAFPRALEAAERALAIDPSLGAAWGSRAYVRLYHEWDWSAAETDFRRAEAMAPSYSTASHYYGNLLVARGRFAEGELAMHRALASEPLSLIVNACIGWAEYHSGKLDAAIAHHRATIELDPSFMQAHLFLANALLLVGEFDEAARELEVAIGIAGRVAILLAPLARAHLGAGRRDEAAHLRAELDAMARERFVPQYEVARVHVADGDPDGAFARLERALAEREHDLVFLAVDPVMKPLRGDPRFTTLAARIGL